MYFTRNNLTCTVIITIAVIAESVMCATIAGNAPTRSTKIQDVTGHKRTRRHGNVTKAHNTIDASLIDVISTKEYFGFWKHMRMITLEPVTLYTTTTEFEEETSTKS
ncbi:uncharacterized protein LOC125232611 [Leguminivora glycinivorella]|uniref:uncharacterized protein LOC125232611 n=1 Tax=Leguminivora glycinivorella TaxID=1035111 RepID=UPI00200C9811|nr:uncharacterized protein LOC125232611 [Leguminivora glycinivorella]